MWTLWCKNLPCQYFEKTYALLSIIYHAAWEMGQNIDLILLFFLKLSSSHPFVQHWLHFREEKCFINKDPAECIYAACQKKLWN